MPRKAAKAPIARPTKVLLMTLLIVGVVLRVPWDRYRLATDFDNTMSFLRNIWIDAGVNGTQLIVRFDGDRITATDGDNGRLYAALDVPTLHEVNYDTTLGDNMIVYTGVGTSGHNKREHGGDLTLRSWFGFKTYIAVNCNGLVTEGQYPN